ncbi:hypothetical protein D3C80_2084660 [compost metagenome]
MWRACWAVAMGRPNSPAMRTSCLICSTELILPVRCWFHSTSSMPQRTCRPRAMPIMLMGSTLSTELSTVITALSGAARRKLARL